MCSISSLVCGDKALESSKWATNRVLTGYYPCIPKCFNTFSMYLFCDKYNFHASRSLWISIPNIFFVVPRSFISNSPWSWVFNLLISNIFLQAINMSSNLIINKWKNHKTIPYYKHNYHTHSYSSHYQSEKCQTFYTTT